MSKEEEARARSTDTGRAAPVYTEDALSNAMMDFLDERADAWMNETHMVATTHGLCAPFDGHVPRPTLEKFRKAMEAHLHLSFVEGGFRAWEEIAAQQRALGSPLPAFAHPATPELPDGMVERREAIARIIDPNAAHARPEVMLKIEQNATGERLWQIALAKADAILALDTPSIDAPATPIPATLDREAVIERIKQAIHQPGKYLDFTGDYEDWKARAVFAALTVDRDGEHPLAKMVAIDEQLEEDNPGWITGR